PLLLADRWFYLLLFLSLFSVTWFLPPTLFLYFTIDTNLFGTRDVLLFKNGKLSTRRTADDYFLYKNGYSRKEAIQNHNPYKEDGVLLINYHIKQTEFYPTDWNTFCLLMDRRTFTKKGEPISNVNTQSEEPLLEKTDNYKSAVINANNLEV
ncbi:MAG: hypothetical protein VKL41_04535, partial [Snowella sp.]|nr:hypothetical protein [Snowella sp.]